MAICLFTMAVTFFLVSRDIAIAYIFLRAIFLWPLWPILLEIPYSFNTLDSVELMEAIFRRK